MPDKISDRLPQDMPDRVPEGMPERMPDRMPEDLLFLNVYMSWWGSLEVK
jgi:hypothetical protein